MEELCLVPSCFLPLFNTFSHALSRSCSSFFFFSSFPCFFFNSFVFFPAFSCSLLALCSVSGFIISLRFFISLSLGLNCLSTQGQVQLIIRSKRRTHTNTQTQTLTLKCNDTALNTYFCIFQSHAQMLLLSVRCEPVD